MHHSKHVSHHLSSLDRFMADLVSKSGHFHPVFRTILVNVQDDCQCVKQASPVVAVLLR